MKVIALETQMGDHGLKFPGDTWEVSESKGKDLLKNKLVKEVSTKDTSNKQDKEGKQTKEDKEATVKITK